MLIDDTVSRVKVHVAGCPHAAMVEAMRSAAQEFLTETRLLHTGMLITFGGASGGTHQVDMATHIVDVLDAKIEGETIRVLAANDPDADEALDRGEYVLTMGSDPGMLILRPAATSLEPVTVDLLVVIAPGPEATEIPDSIWRAHHEALVDGALKRLMALPQRAWSSPDLAVYHGNLFKAAIDKATAHTHRNVRTPARRLRVRPA